MNQEAMPEVYRLRLFHWQLFATLTFRYSPDSRAMSLPLVFVWLRKVATASQIHFKRLLWVLRFETGPRSGRGHYHICLAGIPLASLCQYLCLSLESVWQACGGGLAKVTFYNRARDGVGYILKLPQVSQEHLLRKNCSRTSGDDCEPMLSASLLDAVRRSPM